MFILMCLYIRFGILDSNFIITVYAIEHIFVIHNKILRENLTKYLATEENVTNCVNVTPQQ